MRTKHQQALAAYVRELGDRLELRDWTLRVDATPIGDNDDALARIQPTVGRKHANIEFCKGFDNLEPHKIRHVVAHELIHLHVNPIMHCVQHGAVEVMMGKPAYEILDQDVRDKVEYCTDALADAIAQHLPLIDWTYRPGWARARKGASINVQPYRGAMQPVLDGQS